MNQLDTQKNQILAHLQNGNGISAITALKLFKCFRLASRINELRRSFTIHGVMVEHGGKRYKLYFMECAKQHMDAYKIKPA